MPCPPSRSPGAGRAAVRDGPAGGTAAAVVRKVVIEAVCECPARHRSRPRSGAGPATPRCAGGLPGEPDVDRFELERGLGDRLVAAQRKGQAEVGPLPLAPPGLQPAVVELGVLGGDGQSQPAAARGAGPGRVGAPEAVEDARRLSRGHADSVIPYGHGHGGAVGGHGNVRPAGPRRVRGRSGPGCAGSGRSGGRPSRR